MGGKLESVSISEGGDVGHDPRLASSEKRDKGNTRGNGKKRPLVKGSDDVLILRVRTSKTTFKDNRKAPTKTLDQFTGKKKSGALQSSGKGHRSIKKKKNYGGISSKGDQATSYEKAVVISQRDEKRGASHVKLTHGK